jgi:hypothetical protein
MDEAPGETVPWDLNEHLNGCLAGYQTAPNYGNAVHFALEAIWGIARDVELRAEAGTLGSVQLDAQWIISPRSEIPVPWIWIRALGTAWGKYRTEGGPLGQAFGLEGGGQGKPPTIAKLEQVLNERAIARWIWSRVQEGRARGKKIRIEDAIQDAAEKFDRSDVTIRRVWRRFGPLERVRRPEGS